MEFGVFHEFQCPPGQTETGAFAESFAQVDAAEAWGLDVMWLAELHVAPGQSVLASPLTIAAAIAARTKRIKIGPAVQVLPLCHPLRLARRPYQPGPADLRRRAQRFPRTYEAYGVPYAESRERFAETLEIVKLAWTQPRFTFEGRFHSFRDVCLVPKPFQQPYPEIRVAATSPDTFPANGALGLPVFCAVRLGTLRELGPLIAEYRQAWREAGHPGEGQVYLRVPVYLAETERRAREEPEQSIMSFYRWLGGQLAESATLAGARALERRAERGEALQSITYADTLRDKVIIGTPGMVADKLRMLQEELGLNGILAELNCGRAIPNELVMNSLRLLCEQVIPRFR